MFKEQYLQQLLTAVYNEDALDIYNYAAGVLTTQSDEFTHTKSWSDQLVRDKLVTYGDGEHTTLQITNYGKYWMTKGGYEIFLKEGHNIKEKQKDKDVVKEKEALLEARLRLTHYRLVGFWLTIILSSMGFILSLYNLFLIMNGKK